MSSKLLKKQIAKLHSEPASAPGVKGVSKKSSERIKKQVTGEQSEKRATRVDKEAIKAKNLEYYKQTKATQAATAELMNKVPLVLLWGACLRE